MTPILVLLRHLLLTPWERAMRRRGKGLQVEEGGKAGNYKCVDLGWEKNLHTGLARCSVWPGRAPPPACEAGIYQTGGAALLQQ